MIPAETEFVLEGTVYRDRKHAEGPFVDLTETQDVIRDEPVFEIKAITHRKDAMWQALLPGSLEHKLLMGMPREPTIFAEVNKDVRCTGVVITSGGASWLHAVVQIDKQGPDDGRKTIDAAFRGHGSLKHVWVVDTDIDIYNPAEIEWAMATRFQADEDMMVYTHQPGSSLDPSGVHMPGKKSQTAKTGFDCTIPWGADKSKFEKGHYDPVNLSDYLPPEIF